MPNRNDDNPALLPEGTVDDTNSDWKVIARNGVKAWRKVTPESNNLLAKLEALHKNTTKFNVNPVEAGDTTVVFHWNPNNNTNDITGDEFKITDDPASTVELTEVIIQDGETKRLYLIGSISPPNIGGIILDVLNTEGVLSYTHVDQKFTDDVDYLSASYNDMNEGNATVGDFGTAEGDRVFTLDTALVPDSGASVPSGTPLNYFSVDLSGEQNVNNEDVTIMWDVIVADNALGFNATTGEYTIPETGFWIFGGHISIYNNTDAQSENNRNLQLHADGVPIDAIRINVEEVQTDGTYVVSPSFGQNLQKGQVIKLVIENSGTIYNISGTSGWFGYMLPTGTIIKPEDYTINTTGHANTDALDSIYKLPRGNKEYADIDEVLASTIKGILTDDVEYAASANVLFKILGPIALPDTASISIPHGLGNDASVRKIIGLKGYANNSTTMSGGILGNGHDDNAWDIDIHVNGLSIVIETDDNWTNYPGWITIKYIEL